MREFLRDNPRFKFSIIITIVAIVPMLYLAVVGIIRGKYLATAICVTTAAILEASDIIMIGRKYKQYKRDKSREVARGLEVPAMSDSELEVFWREVKANRYYTCPKNSSFCGDLDCRKCMWSLNNPDVRYAYLKSIFEKEEGDKETMEENKTIEEFLRPGVLFKTESGHWYIYTVGNYAYNVVLVDGGFIKILSTYRVFSKTIVEAYDVGETIAGEARPLFVNNIEAILKGRSLPEHIKTWKRPVLVKEMTMADLEKHFGCKVKIVKES